MGLESLTLALRAAQTSSIATNNIVAGLGKIVNGIGDAFRNAFNSAMEKAIELKNDLLSFYEDDLKPRLEAPISLFGGNSIMDLLRAAQKFISEVLIPNVSDAFNFIIDLPGTIAKAFGDLGSIVEKELDKISFSNLMKGIDKIKQYFIDAFNDSIFRDIVDEINNVVKKMDKLKSFADQSPEKMASIVLDKTPGGGLIQNISMEIHGGFTDTGKMIDKAGKGLAKHIPRF
jgi:DNA-binding protein YbaB